MLAALVSFVWGFLCGAVLLAAGGGYAVYRFLDQSKAQAMATLESQEAEQRRKAEEQARPLTVRGILVSLGIKTEQVDRMMLATSLGAAGSRRASPPHSASSVGSNGATTGGTAPAGMQPPSLGSPKEAGSGSGSGSLRLLALRGGGGTLPRSDSAGVDASSAFAEGGAAGAGEQEWEQLEQLFGDAGRLAKARAKDLKALHATMLALSNQGALHAKALEKIGRLAESSVHVLKKELSKGQDKEKDKSKDHKDYDSKDRDEGDGAVSSGAALGTTPPSTTAGGGGRSPTPVVDSSSAPSPPPGGSGNGDGAAGAVRSATGNRADLWWTHLASMVLQLAEEQRRLAEGLTSQVVERVVQLQERQAHLDKQLREEGLRLLKELQEASAVYETVEAQVQRARAKGDAYVAKMALHSQGGSVGLGPPPPSSSSSISAWPALDATLGSSGIAASHHGHHGHHGHHHKKGAGGGTGGYQRLNSSGVPSSSSGAGGQSGSQQDGSSAIWELPEGRKLARKLQDVEQELQGAYERMREARVAVDGRLPRILEDYAGLDSSNAELARLLVKEYGDLLQEAQDGTSGATTRFLFVMEHLGKADHEIVVEEALKQQQLQQSPGGDSDNKDTPLRVDMHADPMVQLAATDPVRVPPLPPQLVAGIGRESCVWFNAFAGRVYRDACASPLFRAWMAESFSQSLNKGPRPNYVDEFRVENLRFGVLPPMLKNVKWVPTSALEDSDMAYDIAMVADVRYPGGFGLRVSTCLSISLPMAGTARIPLAMEIELVELVGPVRIGVRKTDCYCSFLSEPHARFRVRNIVGDDGSSSVSQLSNVPQVTSLLVGKMKAAIKQNFVHPKAKTFKLLWPRNWWPETTEAILKAKAAGQPIPAHLLVPTPTPGAAAAAAAVGDDEAAGGAAAGSGSTPSAQEEGKAKAPSPPPSSSGTGSGKRSVSPISFFGGGSKSKSAASSLKHAGGGGDGGSPRSGGNGGPGGPQEKEKEKSKKSGSIMGGWSTFMTSMKSKYTTTSTSSSASAAADFTGTTSTTASASLVMAATTTTTAAATVESPLVEGGGDIMLSDIPSRPTTAGSTTTSSSNSASGSLSSASLPHAASLGHSGTRRFSSGGTVASGSGSGSTTAAGTGFPAASFAPLVSPVAAPGTAPAALGSSPRSPSPLRHQDLEEDEEEDEEEEGESSDEAEEHDDAAPFPALSRARSPGGLGGSPAANQQPPQPQQPQQQPQGQSSSASSRSNSPLLAAILPAVRVPSPPPMGSAGPLFPSRKAAAAATTTSAAAASSSTTTTTTTVSDGGSGRTGSGRSLLQRTESSSLSLTSSSTTTVLTTTGDASAVASLPLLAASLRTHESARRDSLFEDEEGDGESDEGRQEQERERGRDRRASPPPKPPRHAQEEPPQGEHQQHQRILHIEVKEQYYSALAPVPPPRARPASSSHSPFRRALSLGTKQGRSRSPSPSPSRSPSPRPPSPLSPSPRLSPPLVVVAAERHGVEEETEDAGDGGANTWRRSASFSGGLTQFQQQLQSADAASSKLRPTTPRGASKDQGALLSSSAPSSPASGGSGKADWWGRRAGAGGSGAVGSGGVLRKLMKEGGEMMMAAGRKAASPTHNYNQAPTGGFSTANANANATAATRVEQQEEEGGGIGASLAHPLAEGGAASL